MKSHKNNTTSKLNKNRLIRLLFVFIGSLFVGLAIIGIFLPGLPTTPFLILAAYFYIRSSNKLYNWLINNKILGVYIRGYLSGKGMPLRAKIISLMLMWIFGSFAVLLGIPDSLFFVKIIVFIILLIGTIFLLRVKTFKK
ncbi:MAG: YbaN family protein [Dehalococcoidia bacterium]